MQSDLIINIPSLDVFRAEVKYAKKLYPQMKSSHVYEALARSYGFKSYNSYLNLVR